MKFQWTHRQRWRQMPVGVGKICHFLKQPAISRKRYKMDPWFLWEVNGKSNTLCQLVTLPTSLSDSVHPKSIQSFASWLFLRISVMAGDTVFRLYTARPCQVISFGMTVQILTVQILTTHISPGNFTVQILTVQISSGYLGNHMAYRMDMFTRKLERVHNL